jgi:hypothetical protein
VIEKSNEILNSLDELEGLTTSVEIGMHNTANELNMLANNQFIENRVYGDDDDDMDHTMNSSDTSNTNNDDNDTTNINNNPEDIMKRKKEALQVGLKALSLFHEIDSIAGSRDDLDLHEASRKSLSVILQHLEGKFKSVSVTILVIC